MRRDQPFSLYHRHDPPFDGTHEHDLDGYTFEHTHELLPAVVVVVDSARYKEPVVVESDDPDNITLEINDPDHDGEAQFP